MNNEIFENLNISVRQMFDVSTIGRQAVYVLVGVAQFTVSYLPTYLNKGKSDLLTSWSVTGCRTLKLSNKEIVGK